MIISTQNPHILTVSNNLVVFPMLIWKSSIFLFIMDETPEVSGELISDQTYISNTSMIHDLQQKGYGEIEKNQLLLKQFETLYLLYTDKLVLKKNNSEEIFDGYTVTFEDDSIGYDEQRFVSFGQFQGRVVAVVHTERNGDIRIISIRKATKQEERYYYATITN